MVAPLIASAGIGAVGSLLGGIFDGGSAKKAARIQQQTSREQIAANERERAFQLSLNQPTITRGDEAGGIYGGLLGLGGADASRAALDTWRGSTGYQDTLNTGLDAVNANAYARGLGDSGATLKALQAKGMSLADQNQGAYLGYLGNLMSLGAAGRGAVAGVSTGITQANNQALGNAADASSNAALAQGSVWQNALKNLTNIGIDAFSGARGSSYAAPSGVAPMTAVPGGGYLAGGLNRGWA
jgi:hypothetical protein